MDYEDIQPLLTTCHRLIAATNLRFKRYLYNVVNWDVRIVGIMGARGVGKTTMMLQRIKESDDMATTLYVSLDSLWFETHRLEELVEFLYTHGITRLYLDEVHKYKGWTSLLKNFHDSYPALTIVYTGSAMLAIDASKTDLSRRQTLYTLHGLSLREYLEYEGVASFRPVSMADITAGHVAIAHDIASKTKILLHFDNYLRAGFYPYYKEAGDDYLGRLASVARLVVEGDIPAVEDIRFSTVQKIKRLLMVVAGSVPMEVNVNKLTSQLETTRDQCLKMLYLLDRANLLRLLTVETKDYKHLWGPRKIYLDNTNLMYALSNNVETGMRRETFFASQAGAVSTLTMPRKGDFMADGRYLFEVGGHNKSFAQIADQPLSFLAVDGIETGIGNRIPLWLFGFLY